MPETFCDLYTEADLYCAAFSWPVDDEVDWLIDTCTSHIGRPAGSVLEPFCGNARYGPVFAQRGIEYWGVDLSESMLQRAAKGPQIHLAQGDARTLQIPDPPSDGFDLAWCPVNSIRHLTEERDILAHLNAIRRQLAQDGLYAIEIELSKQEGCDENQRPQRSTWSMPQRDGSTIHAIWHREFSDLANRIGKERGTFTLERDGMIIRQLEHVYTMRLWTLDDLLGYIRATGFDFHRVHRSQASAKWPEVTLDPVHLESSEYNHIYLLRKRG